MLWVRPWIWCFIWVAWRNFRHEQEKWRLQIRKSVLWEKQKGIGFILLINERHKFFDSMKESHMNEIKYLIFICVPWDKIHKCPSWAAYGRRRCSLFKYCLALQGHRKMQVSSPLGWFAAELLLLRRFTFSHSFSQRMTLLPARHCWDAASLSPGEITDFTFSELCSPHASCLLKQDPGYPSDFPSRKLHVVAKIPEIPGSPAAPQLLFSTALARRAACLNYTPSLLLPIFL